MLELRMQKSMSPLTRAPLIRHKVAAAVVLLLAAGGGHAQPVADCVAEADGGKRLACYDRLFRSPGAPSTTSAVPADSATVRAAVPGPTPAAAAEVPAASASAAPPGATTSTPTATAPAPTGSGNETLLVSTLFNKAWELTPEAKRGTFIVRTYLPNFVLPAHYTSSINRAPSSPTHTAPALPEYRPIEAKLQVSLRAKVAQGLLLPDADLWFAYTQRSFWQVWNRKESSPFRSTDYQPEAIYVVPVPARMGTLPGGWNWRMTQFGLAHQSNGQAGELSRSWNRVYAAAAFDHGEFGLTLRAHKRLRESNNDDNPDLVRYIGNGEVVASWLPGLSTAQLTWRTDLRTARRGSVQLDWTYPVQASQPAGLRWYAQLFSGYGETLLDYNHRQTSLGVGLTLFQF
jgi:phospholipase A1